MNIHFYTLGCKVNQYETQLLTERFCNAGYTLSSPEEADVIVVNSCSVTAESDRKVRQALRRFRRNGNAVIVLCGCLPQWGGNAESLADIITGNNDHDKILKAVEDYLALPAPRKIITPHQKGEPFAPCKIHAFAEHTRAFVKIEDGCDNFCTYCIIPYSRGRVRSKHPDDLKAEAKGLAANGYKEIVLVGINLCNYGKGENYNLCDAVDAVAAVDGIMRIRLGSLEPDYISEADLCRLASCKKFCPNFHLSLQSGCTATLKRMNRHYDAEYYKELIQNIRRHFDHVSVSTDIMCGFPGETDEEFKSSLDFFKDIGFARAHVFAYSRRPGTVADKMPYQISNEIKKLRSHLLSDAAELSAQSYNASLVGSKRSVLFEVREGDSICGYTDDYIKVSVPFNEKLLSQIATVQITGYSGEGCFGSVISGGNGDNIY